jgi:hypothetical protein
VEQFAGNVAASMVMSIFIVPVAIILKLNLINLLVVKKIRR